MPPDFPSPSGATGSCAVVGPVLGATDFGLTAGQQVADVTSVLLPDGRVRLYAVAQGVGVVSAISLTAQGVSFAVEPGVRLPDGAGMPRAVPFAEGVRLFFTSENGIKSAVSSDGLTFTQEPGFRMTAAAAGFTNTPNAATSGATVVPLADGRYRMYFSDLARPGGTPGGHLVKSAVSRDQLNWAIEDGVRLGAGAPAITESAEHPFALPNPDGSVTLFYGKNGNAGSSNRFGVYASTSADGLTFASETLAVAFANDSDALRLSDGSLVLYYGTFEPRGNGSGITVARCPY
jgi:hypothetical protein